jgi:DNA-binding GntR family transcriptional regulator
MLVAYLRGLLKPDYPNGSRSVVRENFILQALSRELDADELVARLQQQGTFVSLLTHNNANNLLKQQDKMLSLAFDNFRHKAGHKDNKLVNMQAIDKLIATYVALKKQGIVGTKSGNN